MAQTDGSLKFDTSVDGKGFERGLGTITKAAVAGMAAVAIMIGTAGTAVINYGSQFEFGMAKVSTIVSGTAAQCNAALTSIQSDLLATSNATGLAATAMSEAAYQALSASVAVADVGKFVDLSAKLAVGGFTSTSSAVDVLSSVVNAYGAEVINADKAAKILMQTQNKGKTTIDELSSTMANVTPTAAAMNVAFEQIGASLATMTAQGVPTAQATTQLNQLFAELGKSGTTASDALAAATKGTEYAGKSFSTLMDEGVPISDLLLLISEHAEKNGKEMLDMFSSIEAGKSALALINKDGQTYVDNLAAMSTSADVVTDAYDKMMDTFSAKKQVFVTSMQNVATAAYQYIEEPLKEAADVGIKWVQRLGDYVTKNGDKIIDTGKDVVKVVGTLAGGMVVLKGALAIGSVVNTMTKSMTLARAAIDGCTIAQGKEVTATVLAAGGISAKTAVMGVFTGQVSLATAATTIFGTALKALGGPLGLTITAITATIGIIGALTLAKEKDVSQTDIILEQNQKHIDKVNELTAAYNDVKEATYAQVNADISQIDHTAQLYRELQTLTDESGNVASADQARAQFIIGELNNALGTEISLTDGQIQNYKDLQAEIAKTIETKKAQILLSAQEESYKKAIEDKAAAEQAAANQYIQLQNQRKELDEANLEWQKYAAAYEAELANGTLDAWLALNAADYGAAQNRQIKASEALQQMTEDYNASKTALQQYYTDIDAYETASAQMLEGNVSQAIVTLQSQNDAFLTAANTAGQAAEQQKQALAQQYGESIIALSMYAEDYAKGTAGYTAAGLQELQSNAEQSKAEASKVGVAIVDGEIEGLDGQKINLKTAMKVLTKSGVDTAALALPDYKKLGRDAGQGYVDGISEMTGAAAAAGIALANAAMGGTQRKQNSNSPAKELIKLGHDNGDGYVLGIKDRLQAAGNAGAQLASSAVSATKANMSALGNRLRTAALNVKTDFDAAVAGNVMPAFAGTASRSYDYSRKVSLQMDVNTHDSYSESELTRQAEDMLDRLNWEVP